MLDLINRSLRFKGHLFEPNQNGTSNVVSGNSCLSTLIAFKTRQLLGFTVKLLDLPAEATHLLYDLHVVLPISLVTM